MGEESFGQFKECRKTGWNNKPLQYEKEIGGDDEREI